MICDLWRRSTNLVIASLCLCALNGSARADMVLGNGEWQSQSGTAIRGTWSITLERSGDELKGKIALTGSMLFSGGDVTGTWDGNQVILGTLADGEYQATFTGTIVEEKISGEWHCSAINDSGGWSGMLRVTTAE